MILDEVFREVGDCGGLSRGDHSPISCPTRSSVLSVTLPLLLQGLEYSFPPLDSGGACDGFDQWSVMQVMWCDS